MKGKVNWDYYYIFSDFSKDESRKMKKTDIRSGERDFLVVQMVKNLSAMRETWVWSLGWEDPLEQEMATYSSILGWRILWTEEPGRLQSMGSQRVGHNRVTNTSTFFFKRYSSNLEAKNSRIRKTFSQVVWTLLSVINYHSAIFMKITLSNQIFINIEGNWSGIMFKGKSIQSNLKVQRRNRLMIKWFINCSYMVEYILCKVHPVSQTQMRSFLLCNVRL